MIELNKVEDATPLDMLRFALLQIDNIDSAQSKSITTLLQVLSI